MPRQSASGAIATSRTALMVCGIDHRDLTVPRTARPIRNGARIIELRRQRRWGADHIAHETGIAASTVQSVLRAEGLSRLDVGDRATAEPPQRYQRERPGELVHIDVKKLGGIPAGGGWKAHGRGRDGHGGHAGVGYRFIHTALDDRTRLAYSEILDDEQGTTAAEFWQRLRACIAGPTWGVGVAS